MSDVAGTYTLESVGGHPLPATVRATSMVTIVDSATRVLSADGSCRETGAFRWSTPLMAGSYTGAMTCRWSLAGRTVRFEVVDRGNTDHYYPQTTATVGSDGRLTEDTGAAPNGSGLYPRVYQRRAGGTLLPDEPLQLTEPRTASLRQHRSNHAPWQLDPDVSRPDPESRP